MDKTLADRIEHAAAHCQMYDLPDEEKTLRDAADEITRLRGEAGVLRALLKDCRTWLDPKTTGDDDSETLCHRIDAALKGAA